jgi:hypothetical protein
MVYYGLAVKHLVKAVLITIFQTFTDWRRGASIETRSRLHENSPSFFNDLAKRLSTFRSRHSSRERTWNFDITNSIFDPKLEFGAS